MTEAGNIFIVAIDEHDLYLLRHIADLEHLLDPQLLYQMLRWQDDMTGLIRFTISEDNGLYLGGNRESTDLDVSEAAMSLHRMSEAVDLYAETISECLAEL